jgi:hypothetical protein
LLQKATYLKKDYIYHKTFGIDKNGSLSLPKPTLTRFSDFSGYASKIHPIRGKSILKLQKRIKKITFCTHKSYLRIQRRNLWTISFTLSHKLTEIAWNPAYV